jgi:hypothetical protein
MHCDFWKFFHHNTHLTLVAVVAVDRTTIKTVVQNLLLVTPMKDVGLGAVGFGPTWLLNPKVVLL